jgi:hypothetical protein
MTASFEMAARQAPLAGGTPPVSGCPSAHDGPAARAFADKTRGPARPEPATSISHGGGPSAAAPAKGTTMNGMTPEVHTVETPSGLVGYAEAGSGPVALFVHGVLLNKHLWRHQLAALSGTRRCIAVDLLAHGDTEIKPGQDVSVTANAVMLREFLDALGITQADVIGNDSGGGISQIFAALNPERVRSLVLTNCDTHSN